jgi:hypothetical protein
MCEPDLSRYLIESLMFFLFFERSFLSSSNLEGKWKSFRISEAWKRVYWKAAQKHKPPSISEDLIPPI